jgi:hypothetical protein
VPWTDRPDLHFSGRKGPEHFFEVAVLCFTQPFRVMFFGQDHRHPGVYLDDEFVGFAGNDRAGVKPSITSRFRNN